MKNFKFLKRERSNFGIVFFPTTKNSSRIYVIKNRVIRAKIGSVLYKPDLNEIILVLDYPKVRDWALSYSFLSGQILDYADLKIGFRTCAGLKFE